ncbi:hypothetical protein ASPWEDRAFT_27402 [Aspergillus wentii DTO 134E9]|uniref:Uncharacterized protein n=1 Tax=Aspergillus wentii DTO 134E9 TaxID=1073089 RepID=A0A1L9RIL7_ASPWE|nr:uncharacterized protein ASPWEDRAFT_27402 [Aspergillus wentii DTO 134E9]KAI9932328.1 hypothetical protein MW887_009840 [Aspergillus wentii]OJJ34707.1 hypothetical protein ASPWEDRAFT_27402 [Aspergillus wentii DTO 134E9]
MPNIPVMRNPTPRYSAETTQMLYTLHSHASKYESCLAWTSILEVFFPTSPDPEFPHVPPKYKLQVDLESRLPLLTASVVFTQSIFTDTHFLYFHFREKPSNPDDMTLDTLATWEDELKRDLLHLPRTYSESLFGAIAYGRDVRFYQLMPDARLEPTYWYADGLAHQNMDIVYHHRRITNWLRIIKVRWV